MSEPVERAKPRTRRLPRAVRERQILDAAVHVFAVHGFHPASMDEISERAGVSKPMLYSYLGAKDELFLACLRREGARLTEEINAAVDTELGAAEQLWRGLRTLFEHVRDNPDGWTLLRRQTNAQGDPFLAELAQWRQSIVRLIAEMLARATEDGTTPRSPEQLEPFSAALVGASESLANWWFEHPDHTADGMARRLMNMVWMGFGDLVEGNYWEPPQER
ncbi:TetR/AcrR family transcriptional regulator [Salinifilum ghardaiensis]